MKLFNIFLKTALGLLLPNGAISFNPVRPNSFERLCKAKHEKNFKQLQ